jgi:hypothetical protein
MPEHPTRIIAEYVADHTVKMTDTAGFGVTRIIHQDICHGKRGITACTDRRWLSS